MSSSPQQARHASPHSPNSQSPTWSAVPDIAEHNDPQASYIEPILNQADDFGLQDYSNDMHSNLLDPLSRDALWSARYHHGNASGSLLLAPDMLVPSRFADYGEPPLTPEVYPLGMQHGHQIPRIKINTSTLPSPSLLPSDVYSTACLPPSPMLDASSTYSSFPMTPSTSSSISPLRHNLSLDPPPRVPPMSPSLLSHPFWSQAPAHMQVPSSPYLPSPAYSPSESPLTTFGDGTMIPATHHQSFPSVVELASQFSSNGIILPQRTYRPHTQSDRRRYVEEVDLEEAIMFYMQNPTGCGISCRDALNSKFMRLVGRDDHMFIQRGPSVSIRLCWPGYAPWSRQIPTRDFRTPPGPITRSKLAKNVAKTVQRFIDEMQSRPLEEDADPRWKVGPRNIKIDDLELIGLQHVSMGSWQVHIRVRTRV